MKGRPDRVEPRYGGRLLESRMGRAIVASRRRAEAESIGQKEAMPSTEAVEVA